METINHILAAILLWLLLWNAYILLFNKGVPNIRTAPAIRKKVIALIHQDKAGKATQGAPYEVYDLGSGNGLMSRTLARAFPDARITGIEFATLPFAWAVKRAGKEGLKNLRYLKEDFMSFDFSNADVVYMFLTVYNMSPLTEKLQRELKPGALVISNKFHLFGWEPTQSLEIKTWYPHQKRLFVYHKK